MFKHLYALQAVTAPVLGLLRLGLSKVLLAQITVFQGNYCPLGAFV